MRLFEKIKRINDFSVLVIKIEMILSIGYFIMAFICKSTINSSESVVREINLIHNFINLGIINFFMSFTLGYIFNKGLKLNKKNI